MSTTITAFKELPYRHLALRHLCYLGIVLALLLYWLYSDGTEIAFVYNAF